jgi:hypothetical protein
MSTRHSQPFALSFLLFILIILCQLVHAVLRFKRSIQCGWLTKKGKGGQLFARKNWCRRWYVCLSIAAR